LNYGANSLTISRKLEWGVETINQGKVMSSITANFSPSLFHNTRCTFQRLRDARIFHGWVESIDEREVTVRTCGEITMTDGDDFAFQVFGIGQNLKFQARLMTRMSAGLANQGMFAIVTFDGVQVESGPFEIMDVSKNGLGMILPIELKKGAIAHFRISCMAGEISLSAEVMNVRPASTEQFRHGFVIRDISRVDAQRWSQNFKREV
jgi:hypothetical protein